MLKRTMRPRRVFHFAAAASAALLVPTAASAQMFCAPQAEEPEPEFIPCSAESSPLCKTFRALDNQEQNFVASLFGTSIDTGKITLFYKGEHPTLLGEANGGVMVTLYGNQMTLPSYALDLTDPAQVATIARNRQAVEAIQIFIHEVFHSGQQQRKELGAAGIQALSGEYDSKYCGYEFRIKKTNPDLSLGWYMHEQQSAIMENYLAAVYFGQEHFTKDFLNANDPDAVAGLIDMVERAYPQAKETRLVYERNLAALTPARVSRASALP